MRRTARFVFPIFLLLVIAAIARQEFGGAVPEGLFNTGRGVARFVSLVSLAACVVALVVLLFESRRRNPMPAATLVRVAVAFVVILELLVTAADVTMMSRAPTAPLGGPYYELQGERGEWLILRKHGGASPFGFRTEEPYAKESDAYRILFLGDSYTEGSGRRPPCNYPTVVETRLTERLGGPLQVMNAGVSGYGPRQALVLLRELLDRGYRADAVVYNFLVENDFTDDLPGTERRVVAGMAFRFPRSWFLRTFHPVNTRTFRTAMFLRGLVRIRYELGDVTAIGDEPCDLSPQQLTSLPETVRDICARKLDDAARVAASPAIQAGAVESVRAMRDEAAAAGLVFVLVLFPDRASADPDVARLMELGSEDLQAARRLRTVVAGAVPGTPVLDTATVLEGRAGMYRTVDTHLSDLGNVVAGEWVADRLAAVVEAP